MKYKVTRAINGTPIADDDRKNHSLCNQGVREVVQEFYHRISQNSLDRKSKAENLKKSTLS